MGKVGMFVNEKAVGISKRRSDANLHSQNRPRAQSSKVDLAKTSNQDVKDIMRESQSQFRESWKERITRQSEAMKSVKTSKETKMETTKDGLSRFKKEIVDNEK